MKSTSNLVVGLDIATKMGVAFVDRKRKKITTVVYKGSPQEQLEHLVDVIGDVDETLICVEMLVSFRNAKTTRSLLTRTGYIVHSLEKAGGVVKYVSPTEARRNLQRKTKGEVQTLFSELAPGITDDETDAIAVAFFEMGEVGIDGWTIERIF